MLLSLSFINAENYSVLVLWRSCYQWPGERNFLLLCDKQFVKTVTAMRCLEPCSFLFKFTVLLLGSDFPA